MNTEITTIEKMNPVQLFQGKKLGPLLKKIASEATSEIPDVSSQKGRDRIKSIAHTVARTKTTLDALGKDLVADQKETIKLVDESRRHARDFLDTLKAKVRQPLTDWENAEEARIEKITDKIEGIKRLGCHTWNTGEPRPTENLNCQLEKLLDMKITKIYAEYQDEAINVKNAGIINLGKQIPVAEARDAQVIEDKRLRREDDERRQREHDDRIAREAGEKAEHDTRERIEAEQAETNRRANEKAEAILRQEREAREKAERELKAKHDAEGRERLEQEKREKNTRHRGAINREALEAMLEVNPSCDEVLAKQIIKSIAQGKISNITINY